MTSFRLMQISDPHFCEVADRKNIKYLMENPPSQSQSYRGELANMSLYPSSFDRDIAFGAAEFIKTEGPSCDALIISGDLATTGRPADLEVAHFFVTSKIPMAPDKARRPYIGNLLPRTLIMPGNHDRYKNNFGSSYSANFELRFGATWAPKTPDVKHKIFGDDDCKLCILLIDLCLRLDKDAGKPYLVNRYGRGRVYDDILFRIDFLVDDLKKSHENINFAWVLHFPPISSCDSNLKLIDHEKILESATKHKALFIMSGHLHENSAYKSPSGIQILSAGSLCSSECADDCWIHVIDIDIENNQLSGLCRSDFKWDTDEGTFVDIGNHTRFV